MIDPPKIKRKALRAYPAYLASLVARTRYFPLEIRFGKNIPKGDYHQFDLHRKALIEASTHHKPNGYTLELSTRQTRRYGEQLLPSRIYFESERDYLEGIGKVQESERFKIFVVLLRTSLPELVPWLSEHVEDVLPYLHEGEDLLKVCLYFRENPAPGCYIRELPIEVHTKFIEEHAGILKRMLDELLPPAFIDSSQTSFALRFGLRQAEPLIRMRLMSERAKNALDLYQDDFGLPASVFRALPMQGLIVVIVENLMTFLTLPASCGDVAVFGKGFQINLLRETNNLAEADILYWSDLDAQGFMMLSQLKSAFPLARSVLMDRFTFDAHRAYVVNGTPCPAFRLPGLTEEEQAMFFQLSEGTLRLEQERISQAFVRKHWPRTESR
jgi:hypothetical protein